MTQLYTSSRLKVFRECMRKHFLRYTLKLRAPETDAMRFGTVGHKALEVYYLAWQNGAGRTARLLAALGELERHAVPTADAIKLRVLVTAYDMRWGDEPWEILAVEQEFEYELTDERGNAFRIGGKIDVIVRDLRDGRVFIVEHKHTAQDASPGSGYWERLTLDTQVSIYVDGATMLGHEIAGCIYDVLGRPKHEPKQATPVEDRKYTQGKGCKACGGKLTGGVQGSGLSNATTDGRCAVCRGTGWRLDENSVPEAPHIYANQRERDETDEEFEDRLADVIASELDEWLIRGVIVRLDDELPALRADLVNTIKLEQMSSLMFGDSPPRNPDACRAFGSMCSFFAVCSGQADITDTNQFPRSDTAHPELAAAA